MQGSCSERKSGGGREGALGLQGTHEANEDRGQGSLRASRTTEERVKWPGTDRAWENSHGALHLEFTLAALSHRNDRPFVLIKQAKSTSSGGCKPAAPRYSQSDLSK